MFIFFLSSWPGNAQPRHGDYPLTAALSYVPGTHKTALMAGEPQNPLLSVGVSCQSLDCTLVFHVFAASALVPWIVLIWQFGQ